MKKLFIAIAASSLLSGCCLTGYTIDRETKYIWAVNPPKTKPVKKPVVVEESSPELNAAIEVCLKEAIIECRKTEDAVINNFDEQLKREILQLPADQRLCKVRYPDPTGAYKTLTAAIYSIGYVSKPFNICIKKRGYYRTTKVISTNLRCKTIHGK